jgi:uncharacterized protein YdeI (YjbR/CyaY-like superfamily)
MDDIRDTLIKNQLWELFEKLPPSHKKEYIKWIDEAKKPETRLARIQKMVKMLQAKRTQ